jgi:allophanate hydrolase
MDLTSLPFQRAALHGAYRAGLSPELVMAEALRRLEAAHDPGIFLDVAPPEMIAAAWQAGP